MAPRKASGKTRPSRKLKENTCPYCEQSYTYFNPEKTGSSIVPRYTCQSCGKEVHERRHREPFRTYF